VFLGRGKAGGIGDAGMPWSLAFAPDGKRVYVGTFQSEAGVLVVDPHRREVADAIPFASKHARPPYPWVDPMGVAVFDRWLLVAVRHNRELVAVDLATRKPVARVAADVERVMVAGGHVYLAGGSSSLTILKAADLTKRLAGVDPGAGGPVRLTLTTE
jgi:DNA-binding beta-propeller fold protein YncE